jgi:hypothetical protein
MEMNTKNVFVFIGILIILLLIAVGISRLGNQEPQTDGVPIQSRFPGKIVYLSSSANASESDFRNDCRKRGGVFNQCGSVCAPDAEICIQICAFTCEFEDEEQNFEELNWERFESQNIGFAISHPFEMDVETVDGGPEAIDGAINFSVWGPTQARDTEFFDGISVTIQKESMDDLGASASARNYAGLSHEHDRNMPVTDSITEPEEITINGRAGYTYTVTSIGIYTHIFLDHEEENMVLHIIYTAPDPTGQGFEEVVDNMLETLTLI